MTTYRLVVEYDGTDFCGFQYQPQVRTIAATLEAALAPLYHDTVKVTAAGRTDAGVHASGQVISYRAERPFPVDRLSLALNDALPDDLTVREAAIARDGFSARFDARRRIYEYLILNRRAPSAALRRSVHHVWRPIDDERFRRAAEDLVGERDFRSFCGLEPERGGTVRTIRLIDLARISDELLRVRIVGDGFLHRMVRIAVGTLVEIATGERALGDIPLILAARDRRVAGYTAPPEGLTLAGVQYDDFDSFRSYADRFANVGSPVTRRNG